MKRVAIYILLIFLATFVFLAGPKFKNILKNSQAYSKIDCNLYYLKNVKAECINEVFSHPFKVDLFFDANLYHHFFLTPETYRHKYSAITAKINEDETGPIGIKFSGSGRFEEFLNSPDRFHPSFKLKFNYLQKYHFYFLKEIKLSMLDTDLSRLRELLAFDIYKYLGVIVPHTTLAQVSINHKFLSEYIVKEDIDKNMSYQFIDKGIIPRRVQIISLEELDMRKDDFYDLVPDQYLADYIVGALLLADEEGYFHHENVVLFSYDKNKYPVPQDLDRTFYHQCAWLDHLRDPSQRLDNLQETMDVIKKLLTNKEIRKLVITKFKSLQSNNQFAQFLKEREDFYQKHMIIKGKDEYGVFFKSKQCMLDLIGFFANDPQGLLN